MATATFTGKGRGKADPKEQPAVALVLPTPMDRLSKALHFKSSARDSR